MITTSNLALKKIELTDSPPDITVINENWDKIDTGLNRAIKYQKAGGTGTAITLTGVDLIDGYCITFIVTTNNSGTSTTINTKSLYKPGGTSAPTLVAGKAATVWYDAAGGCFFIKASAEGDATTSNVLAGKKFSNDSDTGLTGTMATKATASYTPGTTNQTIASGQFLTGPQTILGDADLIGTNIKAGITIFNVVGNSNVVDTSAGDAVAANIIAGKKAYVDGALVTGDIPVISGDTAATFINGTITPGRLYMQPGVNKYWPAAGFYTFADDSDFIAANILATKNIFGLQGSIPVKNTDGNGYNNMNAKVANAWANGTGTLHFPILPGAYLDNASQPGLERDTPMGYITDSDFVANNILNTANIFGLQGSIPVVPPDAGDSFLARRSGAILVGDFYGNGIQAMLAVDSYSYVGAANWVRTPAPDLLSSNITSGKTILGVAGTAKRTASGTVGITDTNVAPLYFLTGDQGGANYVCTVSGLTFKPSKVILEYTDGAGSTWVAHYSSLNTAYAETVMLSYHPAGAYNGSSNLYKANTGRLYVNATGFCLPSPAGNLTHKWYAYE